jgi:prepilin-type N-terminal cleavage/methylation domain-containing protein
MKSAIRKLKSKKGFTLIELLVSVAIFALIVSPLIHAFITAQSTARRSHFLGDATLAASNIIETVKARGADVYLADTIADYERGLGTYTFNLMNFRAGMSGFDIRVTFDSGEFFCDHDHDTCTVDECDDCDMCSEINCTRITEYSPMDGIFVQPADSGNPDAQAETHFADLAVINDTAGFTVDGISREIVVEVNEDKPGEVRIIAVYRYSYTDTGLGIFELKYEFFRAKVCDDECEVSSCVRCFNKSMYVCFQSFRLNDEFVIDNRAGMNLSVFMVKQSEPVAGYNAIIKQVEPQNTPVGEENTRVFANFICNLQIYRGFAFPDMAIGKTTGELVSRSRHDRMFRITIEVFARGELDAGGRPMLRTGATVLD